MKQRLSVRPDSMRKADAAPTSPPAEKPCSKRPNTSNKVAKIPMLEYVGANAMMPVPTVIRLMVRDKACLRP
ncbi:hypothetical protein D3C76_1689110 [compost metagenome]